MFAYYYALGWLHRACWRCGLFTEGTAPTFSTAWHVYGFTGRR